MRPSGSPRATRLTSALAVSGAARRAVRERVRRAAARRAAAPARAPALAARASSEDAPRPDEALREPAAAQRQHVHALARGVDRPLRAERDALVDDVRVGGRRVELRGAEEQQVAGLHVPQVDALALGYFARLFGGGAPED